MNFQKIQQKFDLFSVKGNTYLKRNFLRVHRNKYNIVYIHKVIYHILVECNNKSTGSVNTKYNVILFTSKYRIVHTVIERWASIIPYYSMEQLMLLTPTSIISYYSTEHLLFLTPTSIIISYYSMEHLMLLTPKSIILYYSREPLYVDCDVL